MERKGILVAGGAGFIGSNLCAALHKSGARVVSVDDYSTGSEENEVPGVTYLKADVKDLPGMVNEKGAIDLPDMGGSFCPAVVFHLAEFCRVEQSVLLPAETMMGTYHTLPCVVDFCHKTAAKLIYAGSSTKYGDGESPYATCKKMNTYFVKEICAQLGIPFAITYFYNVYGKREPSTGLFATLIAKALLAKRDGKTMAVTAPGTQKRFFTHVEDIVRGLLLVAEKGHGDEYGIGADEEYSVTEVLDMVGCDYYIGERKRGNRMGGELISAKTKALGWEPQKNLRQYIAEELSAQAEGLSQDA